MVAQTLALAVAGGGKVLGWECPEPTRVLYVDGEQSERAIKGRFKLLSTSLAGYDAGKAAVNLEIMARASQESPGGFLDIADEAQHVGTLDFVKKRGFGLVVLDNLSTLSDSIEDENSAAALKPMQTLLTHLKKLNATVLMVHHSGKDPNKYRGSSALATTFERILGITRNATAPATRIDATVRLEKFRDEVPEGFRSTFPLTFTTTTDKDGNKAARWEVGDLGLLEEAWGVFSAGKCTSQRAFIKAINTRHGTKFSAGNFKRDFLFKWMTDLGKTKADLKAAENRMSHLRELEAGDAEAAGF
jgi:hypothetical protein